MALQVRLQAPRLRRLLALARLQQQKRCCLTIICPVTCAKPGHNRPVLSPVFRNLSFQPSQGCCFSECASPSSTKERVLQICKSTQACLREALPESFANKKPFFVSSTSLSQRTPAAHSCFARILTVNRTPPRRCNYRCCASRLPILQRSGVCKHVIAKACLREKRYTSPSRTKKLFIALLRESVAASARSALMMCFFASYF